MACGIAKSMGAECIVDIKDGYPVVHNHEQFTNEAANYARDFLDRSSVEEMDIRMTAEDFGYYTHQFPSVFYRFGVGQTSCTTGTLHTSKLNINEEGLRYATGLLTWLTVKFLNNADL
jgi:metal-dependent amidase/aminoacylase/carboxypeptidase family protein